MEITNREGVQGVVDAVGGKIGGQALSSLANHGIMIVYGTLAKEETPVSNREMIFRSLTVKGFWLAQWVREAEGSKRREAYETVVELMKSGRFSPQIGAKYDLSEVEDAARDAQRPGRSGKIVLVG
jgi:NADPH:quinone reductase